MLQNSCRRFARILNPLPRKHVFKQALTMNFAAPRENIQHLKLREGMHVADLGAGSGHYSIEAGRIVGDSGAVYAIEVQKDLLTRISDDAKRAGLHNIHVILGDVEENQGTKLGDKSVDAVIVSNILFQAEDKTGLLREACRILKPDGVILLIDWSDSYGGLGPQPDRIISKSDAQILAQEVGFVFKEDVEVGEHHYGFVMSK